MGKDYRYSKDEEFDNEDKGVRHGGYNTHNRNKRNKKRAESAMSRKQRQHNDY